MTKNQYDKKYFEDGVRAKVSGYENYRWIPQRSISEALEIKKNFDFKTCVDFGCANGFLVHALRILGCEAFGEDISDYALENCHPRVRNYLSKPNEFKYDLMICKDVLEHIPSEELPAFLKKLLKKADQFLFVVPFGDNDLFRIREYEIDITHVTKKDEEWWFELFKNQGLKIEKFSYEFGAIKEKWTKHRNQLYNDSIFSRQGTI